MFTQWDIAVVLARDVEMDAAEGRIDPARVARLARSIVDFQQSLVGRRNVARQPVEPLRAARAR